MSNYIASAVITAIGAVIGMTLANFTSSSTGTGAVFGALVGLSFAVLTILPAGGPVSSIPPDMHE